MKLISGVEELATLADDDIADRIGHLKYQDGFFKLVHAVSQWIGMVVEVPPRPVPGFLSRL